MPISENSAVPVAQIGDEPAVHIRRRHILPEIGNGFHPRWVIPVADHRDTDKRRRTQSPLLWRDTIVNVNPCPGLFRDVPFISILVSWVPPQIRVAHWNLPPTVGARVSRGEPVRTVGQVYNLKTTIRPGDVCP